MTVGADGSTGGRRRERQAGEPRKKRFYVSFSDTELAVVRTAAEREGMAWAGRQVMAVAQHVLVPVSRDAGDVLRELVQARVHLRETVAALRVLGRRRPARGPPSGDGRQRGGAGPGRGGPGGCGDGEGDAGEAPQAVMPKKAETGTTTIDLLDYLFGPGERDVRPGTPLEFASLDERLKKIGLLPRPDRSTALFALAAELPAALLARLLGISTATAVTWQQISAGDWASYAADVALRSGEVRPD
ncbi:hypothetical protein ACFXPJ_38730 [Streptomyces goshikiensis]